MEIKGKLVKILPPLTGQGKNGEWKKQEFVIELDGTYPRKVCISTWGDKVNVDALIEGSVLNVHFDIESREYQGKWFTNVTAWKVETLEGGGESMPMQQPATPTEVYEVADEPQEKDDLPF